MTKFPFSEGASVSFSYITITTGEDELIYPGCLAATLRCEHCGEWVSRLFSGGSVVSYHTGKLAIHMRSGFNMWCNEFADLHKTCETQKGGKP